VQVVLDFANTAPANDKATSSSGGIESNLLLDRDLRVT
jgi:hypothetical protein